MTPPSHTRTHQEAQHVARLRSPLTLCAHAGTTSGHDSKRPRFVEAKRGNPHARNSERARHSSPRAQQRFAISSCGQRPTLAMQLPVKAPPRALSRRQDIAAPAHNKSNGAAIRYPSREAALAFRDIWSLGVRGHARVPPHRVLALQGLICPAVWYTSAMCQGTDR